MKPCPKCKCAVSDDSFLCSCGYEFNDSGITLKKRGIPADCLGCLGVIGIFAIILTIWIVRNLSKPDSRRSHPVEITILDESRKPIAGAVMSYSEFEVVPIIPLMPFGPARTINNEKFVTTDPQGKAHLEAKYYATTAHTVTRDGANLEIAYSETTDSYDGKVRQSFPKQLPQWNVGHGLPDRHWESTIIVRP